MLPANGHSLVKQAARLAMVALSAMLFMVGCKGEQRIVAMQDVDIAQWSEPAMVTLKNEQPQSEGELMIVLHVNRHFKAEQVELEVVSMTADSLRFSETVSTGIKVDWPVVTAQSTDIEIPYRHNVTMRKAGQYNYSITPTTALVGVESVGMSFKIENR